MDGIAAEKVDIWSFPTGLFLNHKTRLCAGTWKIYMLLACSVDIYGNDSMNERETKSSVYPALFFASPSQLISACLAS